MIEMTDTTVLPSIGRTADQVTRPRPVCRNYQVDVESDATDNICESGEF
jgi:hypothetical protein